LQQHLFLEKRSKDIKEGAVASTKF
jgi:hypothetical protein